MISWMEGGYGKTKKENGIRIAPCDIKGYRCKSKNLLCLGCESPQRKKRWKMNENCCEVQMLSIKVHLRLFYEFAAKGYTKKYAARAKMRIKQMAKCYKQEYIYRQKVCESCKCYDDYLCDESKCKQPDWWRRIGRI